jgi:DNA primase
LDQDFIEKVREAANIVDIVSEYVHLKKSGRSWRGLCPFHADRNPSFYVDEEKGLYHCFGCGASGNVFRFIMEMEKLTFFEALQHLAKRYGIPIPERRRSDRARQLEEVLAWAQSLYERALYSQDGEEALTYLKNRGFREITLRKFGVGYAPGSGRYVVESAKRKNISIQLLRETGLVLQGEDGRFYDYFRNRIIFPIRSPSFKVIAFGGRGLAKNAIPKYINSPDTKFFKKSEVLFGLPEAKGAIRESQEALIVEGYLDVIALHQAGYENVVAPLGTAFTEGHARLISRYVSKAVILFDGDEAGEKATRRSLPLLLKWNVVPKVALMPEGEDPASLVEKGRGILIGEIVNRAKGLVDFYAEKGIVGSDTLKSKKMVEEVLDTIAQASDMVLQALYLRELSEKVGLMEEYLRKAMEKRKVIAPKRREPKISFEFRLVAFSLVDEELREMVKTGIDESLISDERARRLLKLLKSDKTKDELLAEAGEEIQEAVIKTLIDAPHDKVALKKRLERFVYEKKLIEHSRALQEAEREGDREKIEFHLKEIKKIKGLLGGKGGI